MELYSLLVPQRLPIAMKLLCRDGIQWQVANVDLANYLTEVTPSHSESLRESPKDYVIQYICLTLVTARHSFTTIWKPLDGI